MRLFSVIVLVGALSGCAELQEIGRATGKAVAAGVDAVVKEIPEATKEIVNDPSPGTAAKVGAGLVITFVTGVAGYFALRPKRG